MLSDDTGTAKIVSDALPKLPSASAAAAATHRALRAVLHLILSATGFVRIGTTSWVPRRARP